MCDLQEDGWVVCRVFKKKNHFRGFHQEQDQDHHHHQYISTNNDHDHHHHQHQTESNSNNHSSLIPLSLDHHHHNMGRQIHMPLHEFSNTLSHGSMHLPQLFSPDSAAAAAAAAQPFVLSINTTDIECSQNLLRLTSNNNNYGGDWSFLDKLLTTNMNQQQQVQNHQAKCFGDSSNSDQAVTHDHLGNNNGNERFPFHYLGNDANLLKFPK